MNVRDKLSTDLTSTEVARLDAAIEKLVAVTVVQRELIRAQQGQISELQTLLGLDPPPPLT